MVIGRNAWASRKGLFAAKGAIFVEHRIKVATSDPERLANSDRWENTVRNKSVDCMWTILEEYCRLLYRKQNAFVFIFR